MNTFDQCYDENYEVIKAFVMRRVRNECDAEDITQDVFMVFHRKMDEARNPTAFLYAVARNKVIDFFRSKKSRKDSISLTSFPLDFPDPQAEIVDLDLELSEEMRLRIQGYKFSEIADMLSVKENSLRRRIHYERKSLKQKVAQCR